MSKSNHLNRLRPYIVESSGIYSARINRFVMALIYVVRFFNVTSHFGFEDRYYYNNYMFMRVDIPTYTSTRVTHQFF
jgi:hypothetical protein